MKVENRKIRHKDRTGSGECLRGKKIAKQKWLKKKKGQKTVASSILSGCPRLALAPLIFPINCVVKSYFVRA